MAVRFNLVGAMGACRLQCSLMRPQCRLTHNKLDSAPPYCGAVLNCMRHGKTSLQRAVFCATSSFLPRFYVPILLGSWGWHSPCRPMVCTDCKRGDYLREREKRSSVWVPAACAARAGNKKRTGAAPSELERVGRVGDDFGRRQAIVDASAKPHCQYGHHHPDDLRANAPRTVATIMGQSA